MGGLWFKMGASANRGITMNIAYFVLPLSLALVAAPVSALEGSAPGKGKPNGTSPQNARQKQGQVHKAKLESSAYAQIYIARKIAREAAVRKQHSDGLGRPDRPDRPQRPERPERPEHPGRP